MTVVISAGYSPLNGASGCAENFAKGVAYLGGSVKADFGGWYLGTSFTVEAKGFIGLRRPCCAATGRRWARRPPGEL
jgi:hypothetical protein